jgi:hypothetical protein
VSYNHTRNYFYYKGKCYGVGTVVKIKPEEYGSRHEIERCNGIAKFIGGLDNGYLKFSGIVPPGTGYCGIAIFTDPNDRIEEIIEPVYYEYKPTWQIAMENYQKTPKHRRADIAPGTILYIAAMIVGAIFKARVGIWILATIIYFGYLINIYRD